MCARVFDLFTAGFIHPGTPRAKCSPSSSRCASVLNAGVDMRQRGWAVLNKFPAPDVSVATVSKPYPSVTCCGSGCIGSLVYVCALHRIHLPVVWVLFYGCLEKPNAVCFIWDHGPWFLRVLRNIQPHPLIVKGGFTSVQWGMFPAFTRQQSLDICLIMSKQLSKEYLNVLSKT